MMKKTNAKKLTLHRETILDLQLAQARGGIERLTAKTCYTTPNCTAKNCPATSHPCPL